MEDYGLGTAYERGAVYDRLATWLAAPGPIQSVIEGPEDGFAGMPGLHALGLARLGWDVTVVHASRDRLSDVERVYASAGLQSRLTTINASSIPSGKWDAAICFNALPLRGDWEAYLGSLAERSRKLVVFVTHPHSYGALLRRVVRQFEKVRRSELFDHQSTRRRELVPVLRRLGKIEDQAWVDCPWWPDLFVPQGTGLFDGSLSRLAPGMGRRRSSPFRYGPDAFPWATEDRPAELLRSMRRHPSFEGQSWLSPLFAHHRAYLVSTLP